MKTRKALQALSGKAQTHSPLAEISDQLLLKARTAEAACMDDAMKRSALQACGPMLSVLQRRLAEAQSAKLLNNGAPAIACADLHTLLKTASKEDVKDRGVARAATHAYHLWSKNPTGSLTVGDVARLREHYQKEYPRSKIGSVIDTEVPRQGFNTLPVAHLVRIAAQIQRAGGNQSAYEEACEQYGLSKNDAHSFRCRAFVRSLIEGSVPAETQEAAAPDFAQRVKARLATDSDPILSRFAQFVEDEEEEVFEPEEEVFEPEMESESETFDSPITGEPLRLELEPEPEVSEESGDLDLGGTDLPTGMEVMGQLEDFASTSTMVVTDPTDPEGGELEVTVTPVEDVNPVDDGIELLDEEPEEDFGFEPEASRKKKAEDEDEDEYETIVHLDGDEYQKMLAELGSEHPSPEEIGAYMSQWDYGDGGETTSLENTTSRLSETHELEGGYTLVLDDSLESATLLWKDPDAVLEEHDHEAAAVEKCAEDHEHTADCGGGVQKYSVYAVGAGVQCESPVDTFEARGMSAALSRIASYGVKGKIYADPKSLATRCAIELGNRSFLHVIASELGGSDEAFTPDINEQMPDSMPGVDSDIMVGDDTMGSQAHPFEHVANAVLDGKVARRSGWELKVNADAEVELFYKGEQKRCASLGDMDAVVAEFIESSKPAPKMQLRYAAFEHAEGGFVIVTDLPKEDHKYNAKRILSAVQKIVPATRGTLRKDARLQLEFKAGTPELGRVRRILEDQYRIAEYRVVSAQMQPEPVDPNQQPMQPTQEAQQPAATPEVEGPVTVGPQPVVASWSVMFETPEGEVQDAPVRSKSAAAAKALFSRHNADCKVLKVAQLEELPGEPIGGAEDAPMGIEEQIPMDEPAEMEMASGEMPVDEQEAVKAALTHYRNQGLGPMSALDQLSSQYSDLLDRYGDKEDLDRHEIEAEVMSMIPGIWTQPAILDKQAWTGNTHEVVITLADPKDAARVEGMLQRSGGRAYVEQEGNQLKGSMSGLGEDDLTVLQRKLGKLGAKIELRRVAQFDPAVNNQQPDATSVPASPGADSETDDSVPEPAKINEQPPVQNQVANPGDTGSDSETKDPGSFGAPKPQAHPDQQGESFADTNLGSDSETEAKLTKHMDQASANADGAYRSAKKR